MPQDINQEDSAVIEEPNIYNKKTQSEVIPDPNIGIEDKHTIVNDILAEETNNSLDYSAMNTFLEATRRRDKQYDIIDQMCQDSLPAAVLELIAEDSTTTNDQKQTVWATSDDPLIMKTVQYYIDSLQINKNIYRWADSFIKYGDLYVKLFKRSEYDPEYDIKLFGAAKNLNEDINVTVTKDEDKFVNYVEMVENPSTIFELTRLGKTAGYIETKSDVAPIVNDGMASLNNITTYQYSMHKNDINIYQPDHFVHATLDDNVSRVNEKVKIFMDDESQTSYEYKVKRGQSIFFNTFKVWRELSLLENSLILSRVTKSSITRVVQVETGVTAKEETGQILQSLKQMIEQKAAFNPGSSLAEYTNPGPMENNIYIATHDGKGAITTSQIGGDYDPKTLTDLDYFKNMFFGAFGIPKQFFGDTDDGAGFNGGQSLTIISSKYAKKVIKVQAALTQMITSLINILLMDRGLSKYIGKFTINMLTPTTQEDLDRRDTIDRQMQNINDTVNLLSDIESVPAKLKIVKSMLTSVINNSEVIGIIEEEIEKLEIEEEKPTPESSNEEELSDNFESNESSFDLDSSLGLTSEKEPIENNEEINTEETTEEETLPTPGETGVDLVNSTEEEI